MPTFCVRVEKDFLVFSSGHFITYNAHTCERLHGHNYRVGVEVAGPLDENHYVIDFVWLRDTMKSLVDQLDHHMLLPTMHPQIRVTPDDREVLVTFQDRRWVFPLDDCVLLPVPNTTSELVAQYLGMLLAEKIAKETAVHPTRIRIEIDECFGQSAIWENIIADKPQA
jgi:6-pyruvoyltetrahydropterin/6-carboxytetrahydropterin synthase